jgi:hypothetical protein
MAIHLTSVIVRHERRVRLVFDAALAFPGALNTALYVLSADGATAPAVVAAIAIATAQNNIELALDRDLNDGATYTVSAVGVPAVDASVTPGGSALTFALAAEPDATSNDETPPEDLGALIYGTDLVWDGSDFVETDEGDLASVSGIDNYQGAMQRRLAQDYELDWAPSYGARSGDYVSGPSPLASTLSGSLTRQAYQDDRTLKATTTFAPSPLDPAAMILQVAIVPRGAADGAPITVDVPAGAG